MFLVEAWIASAVIYACTTLGCVCFSLGYSSASEWLEPVLWPRTWLYELLWEQQPGMILVRVCCTRHASPTTMNHKRTYDSTLRLLCARQSFVLTQTRQQHDHHHRNHHRHTTPAPHQQRSRRDSSRGGGDLTSPATVYVPDFKNRGKRQQDVPTQNKTTFQKSEAIMDIPYFWCSYFWSLKTTKIFVRNNRSKIFHNSRSKGTVWPDVSRHDLPWAVTRSFAPYETESGSTAG